MGSVGKLSDPQEYQKIFHWAETQKDGEIPSFSTRRNDPYEVCDVDLSLCCHENLTLINSIKLDLVIRTQSVLFT